MTRTSILVSCIALLGCSGRMVSSDGGSDDGGGGSDTGVENDAGTFDAGMGVDAGPPETCECPAYPTSCNAPAVNEPTFTPGPTAMASQLLDVIACATTSLHIAMYEGDWTCITTALQTALDNDPDLTIDILTDDDRCPPGDCLFDDLDLSDRVTVVGDARAGFMHHKFVIADGTRVWTGSANFSENSFCREHNNAIVVEQTEIVQRYEAVFQRLLAGDFGPVQPEGATIGGEYTVYFSPESPVNSAAEWFDAHIAAIDAATTRIDVMINAWTRVEISDALIAAHTRGVQVQVLVAHTYANDAPAQAILAAGIPIRREEIHDKVLVVDDMIVAVGSPNWSENAWGNNENSLWIANAEVARAYRDEIDAVFAFGRIVDPFP